jgi:hypothetical protein
MLKINCSLILLLCLTLTVTAQKMKPEEVIGKHLESIGTAEAIAAVKTRLFQGNSQARVINSSIDTAIKGKGYVVSSGEKMVVQMNFEAANNADYAREHIGYDGGKINAPFVSAASRSQLGSFVFTNKEIVKYGILGGTLVANWALLDAKNNFGKIEYIGKDKIGEVETHVLRCSPRGGSGLTIKLFFDAQNFRHLRTTYYQETSPPVTTSDEGRLSSTHYKLIEDFSGYRQISGLNLPTTYKLDYTLETPRIVRQYEWKIFLSRFEFNVEVKPELFQ